MNSRRRHGHFIRPLRSARDMADCVEFQKLIWGEHYIGEFTPALQWVTSEIGGIIAGAFDGQGRLGGIVLGISGIKDGKLVHWSHMLAVRADLRNNGLGFDLKKYQREHLINLNVKKVLGTFDPLNPASGYLLFSKLGATSISYKRDAYPGSHSPLHLAIGTDRLISEWRVKSVRVRRRLEAPRGGFNPPEEIFKEVNPVSSTMAGIQSGSPDLKIEDSVIGINVPSNISAMQITEQNLVLDWRLKVRAAFESYFARGYEAMEVRLRDQVSTYLLKLKNNVERNP